MPSFSANVYERTRKNVLIWSIQMKIDFIILMLLLVVVFVVDTATTTTASHCIRRRLHHLLLWSSSLSPLSFSILSAHIVHPQYTIHRIAELSICYEMDQHPKLSTCPDNRTNFTLIEVVSYTAHTHTRSLPNATWIINYLTINWHEAKGKKNLMNVPCFWLNIQMEWETPCEKGREEKRMEKKSEMEGGCSKMGKLLIVSNYTASLFLILFFLVSFSH